MYIYIYFFQTLFHCSLFKDIKCSFYVFHKGKSGIRVLEGGWTEDQMICIYTLGSLIRGKITWPALLLTLLGLADSCSLRKPSCVSTNSGGWQ